MPLRQRLNLQCLEARETPSGNRLFAMSEDGGSRVAVYEATGPVFPTEPNGTTLPASGRLLTSFEPYPGFSGGVRTAMGDITGDGIEDMVTAPGFGGGPHIKVFDGAKLLNGEVSLASEFFAFDASFLGGAFVAVGNFDPLYGVANEIVVGAGESGGPHVRVFHFDATAGPRLNAVLENEFFAFDAGFRGGVRVAAADVNSDGVTEAVTAAGPGGGPHVRVFQVNYPNPVALYASSHVLLDEFFAYGASFRGGVYVAVGELTGFDGVTEIVTGAGEGGGPHVKVYGNNGSGKLSMFREFLAGDPNSRLGVRVGMANLGRNFDRQSIMTAPGPGFVFLLQVVPPSDPRLNMYTFQDDTFVHNPPFGMLLPDGLNADYIRGLIVSV